MQKPNGYDESKAESGMPNYPKAGPCKMVIMAAQMETSRSGNEMLVLDLDIADGEFAGYYRARFEKDERENKKWQLKHYRLTSEEHVPRFKGDIKAIEESNPGFVFDFNESSFVGKFVGCNLREEEYLNQKGEVKSSIKPAYFFPLKDMASQKPLSKKEVKEKGDAKINQDESNSLPF